MEENKYNYKINLPDGISITNVHSYLISYGKAKVIIDTVNENESSQIKIMVEAKDCWNPKDGDICHVTTPDRTQEFIIVYGNKDYSISRFNTEQTWKLHRNVSWAFTYIRPADADERKLFMDKLMAARVIWNEEIKKFVEIPAWRARQGCTYFYIDECMKVCVRYENCSQIDTEHYIAGNYFKSESDATTAAKKITKILKER